MPDYDLARSYQYPFSYVHTIVQLLYNSVDMNKNKMLHMYGTELFYAMHILLLNLDDACTCMSTIMARGIPTVQHLPNTSRGYY